MSFNGWKYFFLLKVWFFLLSWSGHGMCIASFAFLSNNTLPLLFLFGKPFSGVFEHSSFIVTKIQITENDFYGQP